MMSESSRQTVRFSQSNSLAFHQEVTSYHIHKQAIYMPYNKREKRLILVVLTNQ